MIIVIDHDEVSQLQVACCTSSFARNTFHSTTISEEAKCMIVNNIKARLIKRSSSVSLGDSETDCVRETLPQRTRGDLNAWCIMGLWMTWGDAVERLLRWSGCQPCPRLRCYSKPDSHGRPLCHPRTHRSQRDEAKSITTYIHDRS